MNYSFSSFFKPLNSVETTPEWAQQEPGTEFDSNDQMQASNDNSNAS
jgi:hypothetical protein